MEETWYCLYNCYGLSIDHGTLQNMEMKKEQLLTLENEKTEAGSDGRGIKFYCLIKKVDFVNSICKLMP